MGSLPYDDRDALTAVVGEEAAADPALVEALRDTDRELRAFASEHEGFRTEGLALKPRELVGFVQSDELTFWVELDRADDGDTFSVEAEVHAEGQPAIVELEPSEHDDAVAAARALLAAVAELRREAEVLTRRR